MRWVTEIHCTNESVKQRLSVQIGLNILLYWQRTKSRVFRLCDKIRTCETVTLKMTLLPNFYKPHTQQQEKDVLLSQLRDDKVMMLLCLYLYFKFTCHNMLLCFHFRFIFPLIIHQETSQALYAENHEPKCKEKEKQHSQTRHQIQINPIKAISS